MRLMFARLKSTFNLTKGNVMSKSKKQKVKRFEWLTWDVVGKVAVLAIFANNYNLALVLVKQNDPSMVFGAVTVAAATLALGYYVILKKK